MLKLNDGGASYIAESMGNISDRSIKDKQIRYSLNRIQGEVLGELEKFFIAGDQEEEVKKRNVKLKEIVKEIAGTTGVNKKLGALVQVFQSNESHLLNALSRNSVEMNSDSSQVADLSMDDLLGGLGVFDEELEGHGEVSSVSPEMQLANVAVSAWQSEISRRIEMENLDRLFFVSKQNLFEILSEIKKAATRLGLAEEIAKKYKGRIGIVGEKKLAMMTGAMIASHVIDDFVSTLGMSLIREEERISARVNGIDHKPFSDGAQIDSLDTIKLIRDEAYKTYSRDWLLSLLQIGEANIRFGRPTFDPVQNKKLGDIIHDFKVT